MDQPRPSTVDAPTLAHTGVRRVRAGFSPLPLVTLLASGLLPFLSFMSSNKDQSFSVALVLAYAAVVVAIALMVYVSVLAVSRHAAPARVAVGTAVGVSLFFLFPSWESLWERFGIDLSGPAIAQFAVWLAVAAVIVRLASVLARRPAFCTWFGATLVLLCVANLASYLLVASSTGSEDAVASRPAGDLEPDDLVRSPNVYAFLLDAYSRNDVIEAETGYDNSGFHEELDARGFVTPEQSLTSYPATVLSAATMFEGEYPATEPADVEGSIPVYERFIRGDNYTVKQFESLGYSFVHSPPGPFIFARCNAQIADVCIEPDDNGGAFGELEIALSDQTPLSVFTLFPTPRTTPTYVMDELEAAAPDEPFFLFAHVLDPHWSYVYDEDCEKREDPIPKPDLSLDEERAMYANEVRCTNEEMIRVIDRIVEDDPDAIILVFSDHGSELLTDWSAPLDDWSDDQLRERFGVQNNLRLPEDCRDGVGDDTHLVHDFEIVFACLEGREPELLDYRAFLWLYDDWAHLEEVPPERWERLVDPVAE